MLYNFHFKTFPKFRHMAVLAISCGYFGYFLPNGWIRILGLYHTMLPIWVGKSWRMSTQPPILYSATRAVIAIGKWESVCLGLDLNELHSSALHFILTWVTIIYSNRKSYQIQFHYFLGCAWSARLSSLPLGTRMPIGGVAEPLRVECIPCLTAHRSLAPQIVDTRELDQSSKNESSANAHPYIYSL